MLSHRWRVCGIRRGHFSFIEYSPALASPSPKRGCVCYVIDLPACRGRNQARDNVQSPHPAQAGHTPRACCRAASPVLPAVPECCRIRPPRLAYGVVFTGNRSKEKARNFSYHQEVSGFVSLKLELVGARPLHLAGARPLGRLKAPLGLSLLRKRGIYCSIGFIVGNSSTSRMEALSVSSMTRRSTPKPRPPVGGRPYSSAFT